MTRKWLVWTVLPFLVSVLILAGCKKEPVTTPEPVEPPPEVPVVETPPPPPPPPPVEADPVEVPWWETDDVRALNEAAEREGFAPNVYFDFDESSLKPEARDKLQANAEFLSRFPDLDLTIEGHCDERGTNEYNLALGQRRATAAADYLASLGVDEGRFDTISYGEERPVCDTSSESCWQRNRRAHMILRPAG